MLGPDDALPAERDLATELDVSRITVRKAIDGLVSEGLLVRRQGSGTFVRARVEKNFSKLTSFSEDMRARGRTPRSVWLKRSDGTVTPEESLTLRSSPGTPVLSFSAHSLRGRRADGARVRHRSRRLPAFARSGGILAVRSARARGQSARARASASARRAARRASRPNCSRAKPSDAGLLVERLGFQQDGRAVEFSQSYYRGDTYDFVAELSTPVMPDTRACSVKRLRRRCRALAIATQSRPRRAARERSCEAWRRVPSSPARAAARIMRQRSRST